MPEEFRGDAPLLFGASLGRTGTQSLAAALNQLGLRCYGMREILPNPEVAQLWSSALAGESPANWTDVFRGYGATIGWPMCFFAAELAETFPNAKFLMMGRDAESWYDSVARSWIVLSKLRHFRFVPKVKAGLPVIEGIMERIGGTPPDRDAALAAYEAHGDRVRRAIPSERLLEYEVTEGWEPLCAALELPVPDTPFPRTNVGGETLKDAVKQLIRG